MYVGIHVCTYLHYVEKMKSWKISQKKFTVTTGNQCLQKQNVSALWKNLCKDKFAYSNQELEHILLTNSYIDAC
jgi:predicted transcriptional regulator YdeE